MRSSHGPLKLFVGDVGDNRKSDLSRLFSKYGEISTIYIDENKHFAFVEFTSSSAAQRALEHTHNKTVNGSKLRVEYAKSDKLSHEHQRPLSRDHSPTSILYNHLQVTANRLPPMQVFRQSYYQQYPLTMPLSNSSSTSRGRSLTPPSYKQNSRIPSMTHLRSQNLYCQHSAMYSDPTYYRTYGDPYLMQRLPPIDFLPPTPPPSSSSRSYRNMYSSSGVDRYASGMIHHQQSRSRHRISKSHRDRSSRERERKHKRKRRKSASSSPAQKRGPQTPPLKSPVQCSKKRSRSSSKAVYSASEQNSSPQSSSDEDEKQDKRSSSKASLENSSDQKCSKVRTRQ